MTDFSTFDQSDNPIISGFSANYFLSNYTKDFVALKNSDNLEWENISAVITEENPHHTVYGATANLWLTLTLSETDITRAVQDKNEHAILPKYRVSVIPPFSSCNININNTNKAMHVMIHNELLGVVCNNIFKNDINIQPVFGIENFTLIMLLRSIKNIMLKPSPQSKLTISYLSKALIIEIITRYGTLIAAKKNKTGSITLGHSQLIDVLKYIDKNLQKTIHVADMAAIANISKNIFIARFTASMSKTPHQYVIHARTKMARELLITTDISICEIANRCGFSDQAHLCVVFKRMFGLPPIAFRNKMQ